MTLLYQSPLLKEHRDPASHHLLYFSPRAKRAAGIPRPAARQPTSSPACSSVRCASIPRCRVPSTTTASCCRKATPRRSSTRPGPPPALVPHEDLKRLRELTIDLEGHPTPRLAFVDVATGSLGQGITAAVGIALNAVRIKSGYRTYVLLGDGETSEGSVWEAAAIAGAYKLDNLCAIIDLNRLGQSGPMSFEHKVEASPRASKRSDGTRLSSMDMTSKPSSPHTRSERDKRQADHDRGPHAQGQRDSLHRRQGRLARQSPQKGRGMDKALAELEGADRRRRAEDSQGRSPRRPGVSISSEARGQDAAAGIQTRRVVATREAYGTALAKLGAVDSRVVALDADVKNSTFSDRFEKKSRNGTIRGSSPNR